MPLLFRTGPLRRAPNDTTQVLSHIEALNADTRDHRVTVRVFNLDVCPVAGICSITKTVRAGCWQFFNCTIPANVNHWEVRLIVPDGERRVLFTVYHFSGGTRRDDSLTYRSTQLITRCEDYVGHGAAREGESVDDAADDKGLE